VSIGFAVSAGPIRRRFGRTLPAVTGTLMMALASAYWLLMVTGRPSYGTAMFPALVLMGISGGLSQAPMFAAAGTLDPNRATTGSAVLNMSRQVGSALGVALLAATSLLLLRRRPVGRRPTQSRDIDKKEGISCPSSW
jgi:hypothetical protein